ncbi:MAG: hypothetical protein JXR37_25305 [Kiritimatiellae bacterium]|nr:hypothetical protein [Kiritimatiellia bacterium]
METVLVILAVVFVIGSCAAFLLMRGGFGRKCRSRAPKQQAFFSPSLGIGFSYPDGWELDEFVSAHGILLLCPDFNSDWQANVFFNVQRDSSDTPLEERLDEHEARLRAARTGFTLHQKQVATHPNGFTLGSLQFTHAHDAIPLSETFVLLRLRGRRNLIVTACTTEAARPQHQPLFDQIIRSLEIR